MTPELIVIKIGGEVINHSIAFHSLCKKIANLKKTNTRMVLIHGGGHQVNELEAKLGNKPKIVNGRRITDENALDSIKMVIAGKMNIEIVSALQAQGVSAVGLSGVDGNLLNVCRRPANTIDYGFVADIKSVNPKLMMTLLENNFVPVIAPLAADENGVIYNINADTVASAIALAIKASQWMIFSNIDGIYDEQGNTITHISCEAAQSLISKGVITGGMIPKVEAIIAAIQSGIQSVHLLNGLKTSHEQIGTTIT
jgi:acetylglutamate kinase